MTTATRPSSRTRRKLRFATVDEALAEGERLAVAEREGRLGRVGNWTLGQTLGHLATWADYANTEYPPELRKIPLVVRIIARLLRNRVIYKGMMPGMKVGKIPGGTLGIEVIPTEEGLARMRSAFQRLAERAPSHPNPAFGPLTHEQWIQLNLRHAELHFGFLVPG